MRRADQSSEVNRHPVWDRLALAGLVVGVPVVTWCAIGQLGVVGPGGAPDPYYDYMVDPLVIPDGVETTIGVVAVVVVVVSLVWTVWSIRGRHSTLGGADAAVGAPLGAALLLVAVTHRVITAAVIGANIGGGLAIMVSIVVVPTFLLLSIGAALWQLRRRSQTQRRSTRPSG